MAEKKQSLPWYIPTIAGAFVAVYSKIVSAKNPENAPMTLFFYIGLIILLYGLGKYAIKRFIKDEKKTAYLERKSYAQKLHEQQLRAQRARQQRNAAPAQHNIIACPKCGTKHYSSSNFCHMCGARLR